MRSRLGVRGLWRRGRRGFEGDMVLGIELNSGRRPNREVSEGKSSIVDDGVYEKRGMKAY